MGEREGYEVLRLIEHNQKCYISSDYVEGKSLIQWLKYHPNLTKKQLFLWIRDLADQLECIHKCRGTPCYQYVNPYSVIVTEDMTLHFLDMSVESNEKMLVQMNRRSVRENFLPPEVNYYQAASIELDIYGLGRTIQYLLSVTDPIPELTRRETVKFQKIISRCLDGHSKRAFKQMSEIQKEIPNVTEKKSKDRRIWTKKRTVMAMISICVFVAAVSVRVIQKKGDERNTELKMESSDGLNMSEVSEREAFVEAQRSMGLLYFLELEDYEKSIQAFEDAREDQMSENLAALVRYVAGIEDKESSNEKKEYANEKKIENIFRKIEEWMPDDSRLDYERCLIRGYAVEESEEHAKAINKAIFPGTQGGPLMHIIAAKAVCFGEALKPEFKEYQQQVVNNAKALADALIAEGFNLVSGGTDNHLMLVDLQNMNITGKELQNRLDEVYITVNKNSVPNDPASPFVTSGIRIGTPAVTTRGLKEEDMKIIAKLIKMTVTDFETKADEIRDEVTKICEKYPLYE